VEFYNDGSLHCTSLRFTDSVEDESQLIGVRFDMRGYGSCAPFKTLDSSHWVFEGTGLRNGDLFADKSLNHFSGNSNKDFNSDPASQPGMAPLIGNGGSGWETDKITKTSPPDIKLLAKGMNKRRGGADMIIREPENKGIMFSASSITFGGSLLIDEVSSKIVNNVIKKSLSNKK
jgi:N,N-dimethylformamidase